MEIVSLLIIKFLPSLKFG